MRLTTIILGNGERRAVLFGSDGIPVPYANLFISFRVRNTGRPYNTQTAWLGAIRRLYEWSDDRELSLERRFAEFDWLTQAEIEDLTGDCIKSRGPRRGAGKVVRLKGGSGGKSGAAVSVQNATLYVRLTYIGLYLEWLAQRLAPARVARIHRESLTAMRDRILAQRPTVRRTAARKGMSARALARMFEVLHPAHSNNPFTAEVRARNYLMLVMLLTFGLRIGELLSVKVSDIRFDENRIQIVRRPDDPDDPRKRSPLLKTRGRELPLADWLADLLMDYIALSREAYPRAERHPYLFVVHKDGPDQGAPLAIWAIYRMFGVMRGIDDILKDVTPHSLRHSSNDAFSTICSELKVSAAEEIKMRNFVMGWADHSETGQTYVRRYAQEQAMKACLQMQHGIWSRYAGKA